MKLVETTELKEGSNHAISIPNYRFGEWILS